MLVTPLIQANSLCSSKKWIQTRGESEKRNVRVSYFNIIKRVGSCLKLTFLLALIHRFRYYPPCRFKYIKKWIQTRESKKMNVCSFNIIESKTKVLLYYQLSSPLYINWGIVLQESQINLCIRNRKFQMHQSIKSTYIIMEAFQHPLTRSKNSLDLYNCRKVLAQSFDTYDWLIDDSSCERV